MADAEEPFRRPLAHPFQILGQSGGLLFGGHQAPVFFPERFVAGVAAPALVAVAGGAVLNTVAGLAMRAIQAQPWPRPQTISIPVWQSQFFGLEPRRAQRLDRHGDLFRRDDQIQVRRGHRFRRPMVDRQPADHAPRDFEAFERGDQQRNIAAACRLPVIKLPQGHAAKLNTASPTRKRSFILGPGAEAAVKAITDQIFAQMK